MVGVRVVVVLSLVTATAVAQLGARDARNEKHVASVTPASCAQCHRPDEPRVAAIDARGGCDAQCAQCHTNTTTGHHPVGATLPALSSAALTRSSAGRLACRTCHNLQRPATDSVPWRSQSLFDAVFRRQTRYPTYALAVRNDKGQLCQSCH